MYDNAEYANSRLNGTIIQLNSGEPVRVLQAYSDRGINIEYGYLNPDLGKSGTCKLSDASLTPVKLGFSRTQKGISYITRLPMRNDWRQGLRPQNYHSLWGDDKRYIDDKNLRLCILGMHPKLDFALEESYNTGAYIPISRNFAIKPNKTSSKTFGLFYKWYGVVGDIKNDIPQLNSNFEFLKEVLEEEVTNGNR